MKKREQGILTVEASLVLGMLVLFVLFIFNFARVYRAQSVVSHAVIQASDAVAMESYLRETSFDTDASQIANMANKISGSTTLSESNLTSLRSAHLPDVVKKKFTAALSDTENGAVNILKSVGVKDGLDGVNFAASYMDLDNNDVVIYADYTLKMQFPVFGVSEIKLTKAARSKTFGEILFNIITVPNKATYGSTSGGGSYRHGTKVQITATPNEGYKFYGWDTNGDGIEDVGIINDGTVNQTSTMITVVGSKTYKAIFKTISLPINLKVNNSNYGKILRGNGACEYQKSWTISAEAKIGYSFTGWSGYWFKDKNDNGKYDAGEYKENVSLGKEYASYTIPKVEGQYELTANFKINTYIITVKSVDVNNTNLNANSYVYSLTNKDSKTSYALNYGQQYKLTATAPKEYAFLGWRVQGTTNLKINLGTLTANENKVYEAVFKKIDKVEVNFLGPDDKKPVATYKIVKGESLESSGYSLPKPAESIEGKYWDSWKNFKVTQSIYSTDNTNKVNIYGVWKKPSISITASDVGHHSITFTAETFPKNAKVNWKYGSKNNQSYYTLKPNGNNKAIFTINDSNINKKNFATKCVRDETINGIRTIKGKTHMTVTVAASLDIDSNIKQSKKLTIEPTVEVFYYMYRTHKTNEIYNYRHYYNYAIENPWDTKIWEPDYNKNVGIFFRTWNIPYSQYEKAETVKINGKYAGRSSDKNKQSGTNKGNSKAFKIECPKNYMGGYGSEVLAYFGKAYGDKKGSNGYYDYYFSEIN